MKMWVWALIGTFAILSGCGELPEFSSDTQDATCDASASPLPFEAFSAHLDGIFASRAMAVDKYSSIYFLDNTYFFDYDAGTSATQYLLYKYNSNGERLFVVAGNEPDASSSISADAFTTDDLGNVFITGRIRDLNVTGESDLFLAKYDGWGNKQFEKRVGEDSYYRAEDIAIDDSGNIYIAGRTDVSSDGDEILYDLFLSKLDTNGTKIWSQQEVLQNESNSLGKSISITIDASDDVYTLVAHARTSENSDFISKYSSTGVKQWTQVDNDLWFVDIVADTQGYFYVIGRQKEDDSDVELIKLDGSGNKIWSQKMGWTNTEFSAHLSVSGNGEIIIGGTLNNGFLTLGYFGTEASDFAIAKYDSAGNELWNKSFGTSKTIEWLVNMTVDRSGFIYSEFNSVNLCNGYLRSYLMKLDPSGDQIDIHTEASLE